MCLVFLLIPDGKKTYEYEMERSLNEYMTVAAVIYGSTTPRTGMRCLPRVYLYKPKP